jgi:hypothetical protein
MLGAGTKSDLAAELSSLIGLARLRGFHVRADSGNTYRLEPDGARHLTAFRGTAGACHCWLRDRAIVARPV